MSGGQPVKVDKITERGARVIYPLTTGTDRTVIYYATNHLKREYISILTHKKIEYLNNSIKFLQRFSHFEQCVKVSGSSCLNCIARVYVRFERFFAIKTTFHHPTSRLKAYGIVDITKITKWCTNGAK